jgi:hypothetical protein
MHGTKNKPCSTLEKELVNPKVLGVFFIKTASKQSLFKAR